ncbi:MAG: proprotein convertase P-domain-containing protein [Planctomycetes bacterium]|nr:proprotein convertase P-domain-containing protein [Planctomycetota bacterium]
MSIRRNAFQALSHNFLGLVVAAGSLLLGGSAAAQVFEQGTPSKPTSAQFEMPAIKEVELIDVPKLDMMKITDEDSHRDTSVEPPRYAIPNPVHITPVTHGTWENVIDQNGALRSVWRLRVSCENAASINLGFTEFWLPQGASLFIYSPDMKFVMRPFTNADNADHGQLWTPPVPGRELVVELTVERDLERDVRLTLGSINSGYLGFSEIAEMAKSGSCNVDVICSQGDAWRDEISSVAVISTGGSTFCSGFMVNNVRQDLTPFFMTAYHCGISSANAASLVAFWNYENSTCRTPGSGASGAAGDGTLTQFNTGSTFLSRNSPSDFTLVRLTSSPNPAWYVSFAGWNANNVETTASTGIHHPNVEEKRISFDLNPSTTTSYSGTTIPGDGTHIRIGQWEIGTTEGGSSGSPLFNQNHQVVGQLHGGSASCSSITSDYYGRFSVSWLGGGTAATQLKTWLDPDNTGTMSVNTLSTKGLTVSPSGAVTHSGLVGGPFTPSPYNYTLSNSTPSSVNYKVHLTNNIGLLINGGSSDVTGTLAASGGSAILAVTAGPVLATLPAGIYTEDIVFTDLGTGVARTIRHTVEIGQTGFSVTPAEGLATGGPVGGPFTGSKTYRVTSTKAAPVSVTVQSDAGFVDINLDINDVNKSSSVSFTLDGVGDFKDVDVSIDASANSLAAGLYNGDVTFSKADGPADTTTRNVSLDVGRSVYAATDVPIAVADNSTVYSYITVNDDFCIADVDVDLNVSHTYIGDLYIELRAPNGTTVILHNRTGGTTDNIVTTYDDDGGGTLPFSQLSDLDYGSSLGVWRLRVSDQATTDTGTLNSWALRIAQHSGTCPTPVVVYSEPMDSNPGWTTEGLWAWGTPAGAAVSSGSPDPTSGFTGTKVYGYNNVGSGLYENSLVERNLTTPAFDCTGLSGVKVAFQRRLNVESSTYDHAAFKVSTNGTTWTTVFQNGTASMSESAWTKVSYSVAAIADNQPTVYFRWTMGTTDTSVQYSGWNIDDFELTAIVAAPACPSDLDGDGVVDGADVGLMLLDFGPCPGCAADLDGDGMVDGADVGLMLLDFGPCPS